MDLRALRAFVEVVKQGGFSQAARAIHATQPTVSKAVRQLEDEIGMPLLDRQAQPPRLTPAGEIVYGRAQTMLTSRDDLIAELQELRGMRRGVLRLGLPTLGSNLLFAPLFARFRRRYPGVEISLAEHGSRRLEDMVSSGDIELGATLAPVPPQFACQAVAREPMVVLLPPDHPLARSRRLRLAQLRDTPFILFESGFALNHVLLAACERSGFTPTVAARSGQTDFISALVASGMGVGFLPQLVARERRQPGVRQVPLDPRDALWEMMLIWRAGGYLSHAAQAWLTLSREVYGEGNDRRASA
ncbi:LysR family transcriptional regulator [Pseudomonadota bacterium AL_CKDN230030165-1A_HGKHYDSX7]